MDHRFWKVLQEPFLLARDYILAVWLLSFFFPMCRVGVSVGHSIIPLYRFQEMKMALSGIGFPYFLAHMFSKKFDGIFDAVLVSDWVYFINGATIIFFSIFRQSIIMQCRKRFVSTRKYMIANFLSMFFVVIFIAVAGVWIYFHS